MNRSGKSRKKAGRLELSKSAEMIGKSNVSLQLRGKPGTANLQSARSPSISAPWWDLWCEERHAALPPGASQLSSIPCSRRKWTSLNPSYRHAQLESEVNSLIRWEQVKSICTDPCCKAEPNNNNTQVQMASEDLTHSDRIIWNKSTS